MLLAALLVTLTLARALLLQRLHRRWPQRRCHRASEPRVKETGSQMLRLVVEVELIISQGDSGTQSKTHLVQEISCLDVHHDACRARARQWVSEHVAGPVVRCVVEPPIEHVWFLGRYAPVQVLPLVEKPVYMYWFECLALVIAWAAFWELAREPCQRIQYEKLAARRAGRPVAARSGEGALITARSLVLV